MPVYHTPAGTIRTTRRVTVGELSRLTKAKADDTQVAVYDANGTLIGTVAQSKIAPLAASPAAAGSHAAVAARVTAEDPDAVAAANDVAKALHGATFRTAPGEVIAFAKAAGTIEGRFDQLLKSIDDPHAAQLRNAIATASLRLMTSERGNAKQAVKVAKSIALDVAARQQRRSDRPSQAQAVAAFRRAVEGRR